jgi:hypothetical protein
MLFVSKAASLSSKVSTRRARLWRPVERYQRPRWAVSLHYKGDRCDVTMQGSIACCRRWELMSVKPLFTSC